MRRAARPHARRTSRSTWPVGAARRARARATRRSRCSFSPTWRSSARRCRGRRFKDEVLGRPAPRAGRSPRRSSAPSTRRSRTSRDDPAHRARARAAARRSGSAICRSASRSRRFRAARRSALKLARALSERAAGRRCFVLDEPSAGPPPEPTSSASSHALDALVRARARACVVVEHDLDVMRAADWIIDLGPGGGRTAGGRRRGHAGGGRRRRPTRTGERRFASGSDRRAAPRDRTALRERGRRCDRGRARARAQPARGVVPDPARQARRGHRAERIGQEHARVRRGVRRGAAALPGDADALCAPVPADACRGPTSIA